MTDLKADIGKLRESGITQQQIEKELFGKPNGAISRYFKTGKGIPDDKIPVFYSIYDSVLKGNTPNPVVKTVVKSPALPQRSTTGYNLKRLNMILAVLEKRAGFRLGAKDVFLNITGGITVDDPAIDLAVVGAILSSNEDITIDKDFCFAGGVGLTGEIRPVNRVDQRIQEAEKLGFSTIFVSKFNKINPKDFKIDIRLIAKVEDLVQELFG